jgi:SCY1-like protein 1
MGTPVPSEGLTWTGWAISSFTNKITTANGQMQTSTNGNSQVTSPEPRSSSVPATTSRPALTSKTSTTTTPLVSSGLNPTSSKAVPSSNPFASPPPEDNDEDFDASWGDDDASDPFAAPASSNSTEPTTLFDDKGEPDFSGWLNAQTDAKKPKKPLPKGLAKPSAAVGGRPAIGAKANSTGGVKKVLPLPAKKVVAKKEEKVEEDDEGWGDAW